MTTRRALALAGGLPSGYRHPSAAWAELGLRGLRRGLLAHHCRDLLRDGDTPTLDPDPWSRGDLRRLVRRTGGRLERLLLHWPLPRDPLTIAASDPLSPAWRGEGEERDGVDVVIATLGRPKELTDLLDDLAAQTAPPERVILVEQLVPGAEPLDPLALESRNDPYHLAHRIETVAGASRARNLGLAETTAPWVALLDDDVRLDPGFLAEVRAELDQVPAVTGIGVLALAPGEAAPSDARPPRLAESLGSGRAVVRRRALLEVGGFDEQIEGWGEDMELGLRLQLAGHTLLESRRCHLLHLEAPRGGFRVRPADPRRPRPAPAITYRWLRWLPPAMLRGALLRHFLRTLPRGPGIVLALPGLWRAWRRSRAAAGEGLTAGPRYLSSSPSAP